MFSFLRSDGPSASPSTPPASPKNSMPMVELPGGASPPKPPPNTPVESREVLSLRRPSRAGQDRGGLRLGDSLQEGRSSEGSAASGGARRLRRLSSVSIEGVNSIRRRAASTASYVGDAVGYGVEFVSGFWFVVTTLTLFTGMFTMFALVYLNYNEVQHPGQVDLVGTSVSHALTIHSSSSSPAELRFLTGFSKDETVGFRLDEDGGFEMYRAFEEELDKPTIVTVDKGGGWRYREDVVSDKAVHGKGLYASHDGFHFPDGSVMTTAAETSVGLKSETDLNLLAGVNQTGSAEASIIMTVGDRERVRITKEGIFFRKAVEASDTDSTESFDEGISFYPDMKMIKTGEFQMASDGLSTTNPESEIVMHASQLVLNDTSSSPNGATISVSTAVHLATGQPFVITGQSAILTGGDTVVNGGHGSSRGGDTVINGGKAESRHGDVIIGDKSYRTTLASNRTEITASSHLRISSDMVDVEAPMIFNSALTAFSKSAFKAGASFSSFATVTTMNITIAQTQDQATFSLVEGSLKTAYSFPVAGGYWGVAESCTTCISFGPSGSFVERHGTMSLLVEGIRLHPASSSNPSDDSEYLRRTSVSCAVVKTSGTYPSEINDISYDNSNVVMIVSVSFFDDDEYVSLGGARSTAVEGNQEYSIFCRAKIRGQAGSESVRVSAEVATLGIML